MTFQIAVSLVSAWRLVTESNVERLSKQDTLVSSPCGLAASLPVHVIKSFRTRDQVLHAASGVENFN